MRQDFYHPMLTSAFFQLRSESICLESFFIESKAMFALSIFSCDQIVGSAQYSAFPNNRM